MRSLERKVEELLDRIAVLEDRLRRAESRANENSSR
jgi:hypothetical protein